MNKIKNINEATVLYYYCRNHDTSKSSLDGKRHSICDAKINLIKQDKFYILITNYSYKCKEFDNFIKEASLIIKK